MKNFFRTLLLSTSFASVSFLAISQPQNVTDHVKKLMPTPVPQSPNVAALGKYGDYQVNHFNGIPDISIPIFEAKSGSLSVPITLSYHASGVKPTDVASWVGMGWSLSAGGEVSRQVQGKPDEQHYYSNALKQSVAVCGPPGTGTFYYLQYAATNVIDTEPDIFSYSMPGQGGKFILPNGAAPITFPYAPIVLNTTAGFGKFEITDQQGVLHRFGLNGSGSKMAQDVTLATNGGNPSVSGVTAWHLMEMVAPNSNDQITFDYQSLGASPTHDISYSYTVMDQCFTSNGGTCPSPYYYQQQSNNDATITQMGLQTITFENGKIVFELSTGNRGDVASALKRLDRIKVYSTVNGVDVLQKTIQFNYSYFTNAVGGNQALKLDGVQFLDKASVSVQNYTFTYFTNAFSWTPNAVNFLNARDLWGYYNGATANTDLILPQTISFQQTSVSTPTNLNFGGAFDRTVNQLYIKEGVLKRINFPTGGYTDFDYESNKYDKSGVTTTAGGLRVTKITSSDGSGLAPIVKVYKYGNAESGLGLPNFLDNEFNYNSSTLYYSDCDVTSPVTNYQTRTYFSHSFGGESPIMYPYVTEYLGDPTGTTNGKTVYVYDGGSPSYDATNTMPGSSKIYKNSFSWKRGKLTSKTVYDNTNKIISSTSISRSLFQSANNFVGWSVYQFIAGNYSHVCSLAGCLNESNEDINPQTYKFGTLYQSSGVLVEDGVTETTYQDGDINKLISNTQSKSINSTKLQVTQSTQTTSVSGEQLVTVNKYPFDFSTVNASSTGAAKGIYKLNQKNILSTPVETYTYRDLSGTQTITSAQITTFRENSSNTNYVVPDQIFLWESATPVAIGSYSVMTINGSNSGVLMDAKFAQRINMVSYDEVGNIQTVSKVNDAPVAYLYGYNKTMPIAEVVNAQNSSYSNIQNVSTSSITMNGPTPSVTGSSTFTVAYTGNVYLKLGVSGNPTYSTLASYSGITSGSVTLGKNACGITVVTFTNVAPGTYTINITLTTPDSGVSNLGACGQIEYPGATVTGGVNESYYENFEDYLPGGNISNSSTLAHTGDQYWTGFFSPPFTIPTTIPMRSYIVEYWYYSASKWVYKSIPFVAGLTLAETTVDDVRIYPKDAQMKSYTYNPILGMTSSINENGLTYTYEYDTFGRLLLIRDQNGKIEKQYSYHYKAN